MRLLARTHANPALGEELAPIYATDVKWLVPYWDDPAFDAYLCEFAARVCYRSVAQTGESPAFLRSKVLGRGHVDVAEHARMTVMTQTANSIPHHPFKFQEGLVHSATLRVWRELAFSDGAYAPLDNWLRYVAPYLYDRNGLGPEPAKVAHAPLPVQGQILELPAVAPGKHTICLGYTWPFINGALFDDVTSVTFYIHGVSRTCTHQLVRHRLGSFSQESQRYVRMPKGEWQPVVPPAVQKNPEAMAIMQEAWAFAEKKYAELTDLGIRGEDARFILPQAADSRLVMTMTYRGWRTFLDQRLDRGAQWEIRAVAEEIKFALDLIENTAARSANRVTPTAFAKMNDTERFA